MPAPEHGEPNGFPSVAQVCALRAWYEGVGTRDAVMRYLGADLAQGDSSRSVIRGIRKQLVHFAHSRRRADLAKLLLHPDTDRVKCARSAMAAIETLRACPEVTPLMGDDIDRWLGARPVAALKAQGIKTLADLAVRIQRRKMWWTVIAGLGTSGARQIEAFFARHPPLMTLANASMAITARQDLVPWEVFSPPLEVDGSQGTFRGPRKTCTLTADNDYEAVRAWLSLHESASTSKAYRKEAERLILWAVFEQGKALSSLSVEDAVAYRAFLRRPLPAKRWVAVPKPRTSPEWKPFAGPLSARSVAYALSVLGAMYRWLMEQGYLLANPFSGIKVRGAEKGSVMDAKHVFTEGEWALVRTIADGLEWSYGWKSPAAQRLRFVIDFAYCTGLRASELTGLTLQAVQIDVHGDHWLHLVGKASKAGKVAMPPLLRSALDRYLVQRGLPITPSQWAPDTPLIATLDSDTEAGITATRLRSIMRQFFETAALQIEVDNPALAQKLRRATPHWMRHTHATHALVRGAELTTVRDNLRHASIATTSIYLHGDDVKRARQMRDAFSVRL